MSEGLIALLFFHLFLVAFGFFWAFFPPKEPNYIFGFRTRRSSSSVEAWKYANGLFAKIFLAIAAVAFALQLGVFFVLGGSFAETFSAVTATVTMVLVCILGVLIQVLLCRKFDASGNAK